MYSISCRKGPRSTGKKVYHWKVQEGLSKRLSLEMIVHPLMVQLALVLSHFGARRTGDSLFWGGHTMRMFSSFGGFGAGGQAI